MNAIVRLCLVTIVATISTGCGIFNGLKSETPLSPENSNSEVKTGIDVSQDPIGAIFKAIELGRETRNLDRQDPAARESVEPVSFRELIEYLPEAPAGWTAREPQGETNSFGNYSISQVSRAYVKDRKNMKVSIFDWTFNSVLSTPFLISTEFSHESTSGYNKGIVIGDLPGREEYTYRSKKGSLNLLVNSRFLVQIDGRNIEEQELRQWWQLIDDRSLSKINRSKN